MSALRSTGTTTRSRTAHEYAKQQIREAILDGTLAAGSHLPQVELAKDLGISTTPVREALRELATEGLVHFDAHRGALVRSIDFAEVEEIYDLRIMLEPVMIRRLQGAIRDEDLAEAERLHAAMQHERNIPAWVELNRLFHTALSGPSDGSRLAGILAGLRNGAAPWVRLSLGTGGDRIEKSLTEHGDLLDLYRRRDVEGIVTATVAHLEGTLALTREAHLAEQHLD